MYQIIIKNRGLHLLYVSRHTSAGNDLLKDQLNSIREILEISDDEKLNAEIRERITYEEKAYESAFGAGLFFCLHMKRIAGNSSLIFREKIMNW